MRLSKKRGFGRRVLGLVLALCMLIPASVTAFAADEGFITNLVNLTGQQGNWTETDNGLRARAVATASP
ncbi:hypothetical protein [Zongyangia hominis]|uniref:Uncharacterized protein n=1 Tax=Zongyangia hominis TaxID=2763677 RepID=A0A926EG21_9FIRM|nr:hypothetical protein [Zongyangia hominis]MBC8571401.1 hypothetical protein [Zongyangia hominis]